MQQENQWLQRVLSIDEDTPYHSNLTAVTEPSDDHSVSADEALNIGGITVFRLEKGRLTFRFFVDADSRHTAPY